MGLFSSRESERWKFLATPQIVESNFDRVLERFYKLGVKGLTKENIQNSLDGRLLNSDLPVIVKIKIGDIDTKDIPGISEVINHINALEGRNSYSKGTIAHMLSKINQEKVPYISFEDLNTKGLSGAKNGQSQSKEDTWGIYAYNTGVHFEETDDKLENMRGGSHGVGKISSNSASDLHLMYFANCDESGNQHLGGTVQLIEHRIGRQCYRSTGYFTDQKREDGSMKFYPYENTFHQVFRKDTRGLKIVIPYLQKGFDDEVEIIKSVCDSFFVSILENKLEIHINEHIINKNTIEEFVSNPDYYEQDVSNMKKVFTPLYIKTYKEVSPREIYVSNREKEYKYNLYFKYDEDIVKGRVAIVRTIGMKIEDFVVKSNATKPFNAILIGGIEEDGYLKSLENESHTEISHEHIRDDKLKSQGRYFINKLSAEVAKVIDEEMRKNNPPDGPMNTADLIYTVESQFKKDLGQAFAALKLNKGTQLAISPTIKPERRKDGTKTGLVPPKNTGTKRKRKVNSEGDGETKNKKEVFKINPTIVERVLVRDDEFIKFNFSSNDDFNGVTSCDLSLRIIDGMGKEYENEIDLKESYNHIVDGNTGEELRIEDQTIKAISIKNNISKLTFKLKPNFNRALKFIYYVEV